MARARPSREPIAKGGPPVLAIAWVLAIGLAGAVAGYLAWHYDPDAPRIGEVATFELPPAEQSAPPQPATAVDTAETVTAQAPVAEPETIEQPAYEGPPRIAVVVTGLGLVGESTRNAIDRLPAGITLSFSPYADALLDWIPQARAKGHEVMIDLPMEPVTFPLDDPGPQALLTGLTPEENLERLRWVLDKGPGTVGVAVHMGSRFVESAEALHPVLSELRDRGVLFLDNGSSSASLAAQLAANLSLPYLANDRMLDAGEASREAINARLVQIERVALTDGIAVAMARAYPVTLERLANWTASLAARGFALTPVTALAGSGSDQQAEQAQ